MSYFYVHKRCQAFISNNSIKKFTLWIFTLYVTILTSFQENDPYANFIQTRFGSLVTKKKKKKKICGTENAGLANIHCLIVTENEDKVLMWSFHNKDILYYNSRWDFHDALVEQLLVQSYQFKPHRQYHVLLLQFLLLPLSFSLVCFWWLFHLLADLLHITHDGVVITLHCAEALTKHVNHRVTIGWKVKQKL